MCDSSELQELLDQLFTGPACSWCGDHGRKLYGKKVMLCSSCRNIKALVRKWAENANANPFGADELAIAKRMEKMAKDESARFGHLNKRQIDGVDLEHAFNEVARIAIHQELPYNDANVFEQCFTLAQRRFLFYLLSRIIHIYERRHRKITAAYASD